MYQPAEILTKWAEETGTQVPYHVYLENTHRERSYNCKASAHYFDININRLCRALRSEGIPTERATQLEVVFGTRDPAEVKIRLIQECVKHGSSHKAAKALGVGYFCVKRWAEYFGCVFYVFPILVAKKGNTSIGLTKACELAGISKVTAYKKSDTLEFPTVMHYLETILSDSYTLVIPCGMDKKQFKKIAPAEYFVDATDGTRYIRRGGNSR